MPVHLVHLTGRAVWLTAPLLGPSLGVPAVAGQRHWTRSVSVPPRLAAHRARGVLTARPILPGRMPRLPRSTRLEEPRRAPPRPRSRWLVARVLIPPGAPALRRLLADRAVSESRGRTRRSLGRILRVPGGQGLPAPFTTNASGRRLAARARCWGLATGLRRTRRPPRPERGRAVPLAAVREVPHGRLPRHAG